MRSPLFCHRLALLPVLALALLGCSSSRKSGQVSGKVTANGQPLSDIGVTFEPTGAGAGQGSFGRTDDAGHYSLQFIDTNQSGALIGAHTVTFADMQNVGGADEPDAGPSLPRRKSRLPASVLDKPSQFEVKSGQNEANFDLK